MDGDCPFEKLGLCLLLRISSVERKVRFGGKFFQIYVIITRLLHKVCDCLSSAFLLCKSTTLKELKE